MGKTYNYLKISLLFCLAFLVIPHSFGQINYYTNDSIVFKKASVVLQDALAGGFQAPLFNHCDVNGDNKKDLVIYDKLDGKILVYQNVGTASSPIYKYVPQFENYFPKVYPKGWFLMRDYNLDGYEDIFVSDAASNMKVYKNISYTATGRPAFDKLPNILFRNNSPDGSPILYNELNAGAIHMPGIVDMDFDGDLDFATFTNTGGAISYFKNMQVEQGLSPDSMRFMFVDLVWGNFYDVGSVNFNILLNQYKPYDKFYKRHVTGTSVTPLELDNDGDIDLLMGNSVGDNLVVLKNGKADYNGQYDSMIFWDSIFPRNSVQAKIKTYPAAFHLDVDGDNNRDLIVAPYSTDSAKQTNQVMFYKNTGTDLTPVFTLVQSDFLAENLIDHGARSAPAFWDYDGDGDLDLFIATNGDIAITHNIADRIVLYKNTGTVTNPVYELENTDFANISAFKIKSIAPAFVDLDNDGKMDILTGNDLGEIKFYKNTSASATQSNPVYTLVNNNFISIDNIDVGSSSMPAFADLNKDGKMDMVIGSAANKIFYYENTGTTSLPAFTKKTDKFGNMRVADSVACDCEFEYDSTGTIIIKIIKQIPIYDPTPYSAPAIYDFNGDGNFQIVFGHTGGTLKAWNITANPATDTFPMIKDFYYTKGTQADKFKNTDFGLRSMPAIANIRGDKRPEIITGNFRGGINLLSPAYTNSPGTGLTLESITPYTIYPNPSSHITSVYMPFEINNAEVNVYNQVGQLVFNNHAIDGSLAINIETNLFSNGVYFVSVKAPGFIFTTKRLVVLH